MPKLAGLKRGNGGPNQISSRLNAAEFVGRKFKNRNASACEVLLVLNILIGSDEQIKFVFGSFQ